jgi:RimJ/RimL family protein N-acetyltransferase
MTTEDTEPLGTHAAAFDLQPTLTGRLVTLRPLRESDFDALYAVASDPLIWEQHPERERYQDSVFRRFFREAMDSKGALLALETSSGQVIGSSRYYGLDPDQGEVEIGWTFLARSHWGGAYNGEMKALMLAHAFQFVERVVFLIGPQNYRSQRAIEKIGGVRIGTRLNTRGQESLVFEITAHRWSRRGSDD